MTDNSSITREMGEQPIAKILESRSLTARDLVAASETQMTFKMVSRAVKGRRLTPHTMNVVRNALNRAACAQYSMEELFNYK